MRLYTVPARYQRYLESVLAIEIARIGRDVKFREVIEEGDKVRHLAPVEDAFIDPDAQGRSFVLFGVSADEIEGAIGAIIETPRQPAQPAVRLVRDKTGT